MAQAAYPYGIKTWQYRRDNLDKVVAADVNSAYDEITAVQTQLGVGGVAIGQQPNAANYLKDKIDWTNDGGLVARLQNIENGLYGSATNIDGGNPTSTW
jgi:hypothetical protein